MNSRSGFTFIEVLVAMLIFVMAVVATVGLTRGSVRATHDAREVSIGTWLLQNVMSELETKLETEGLDKGCEKKKEAKFEAPYQNYTWQTSCYEIDFSLSQTAAQMMQQKKEGGSENTSENQILKLILDVASAYMTKSLREIHAEVSWMQGKQKRTITATTHVAKYDQPLALPSAGGGTSSSSSGSGSTGSTGGGTTGGN